MKFSGTLIPHTNICGELDLLDRKYPEHVGHEKYKLAAVSCDIHFVCACSKFDEPTNIVELVLKWEEYPR